MVLSYEDYFKNYIFQIGYLVQVKFNRSFIWVWRDLRDNNKCYITLFNTTYDFVFYGEDQTNE